MRGRVSTCERGASLVSLRHEKEKKERRNCERSERRRGDDHLFNIPLTPAKEPQVHPFVKHMLANWKKTFQFSDVSSTTIYTQHIILWENISTWTSRLFRLISITAHRHLGVTDTPSCNTASAARRQRPISSSNFSSCRVWMHSKTTSDARQNTYLLSGEVAKVARRRLIALYRGKHDVPLALPHTPVLIRVARKETPRIH